MRAILTIFALSFAGCTAHGTLRVPDDTSAVGTGVDTADTDSVTPVDADGDGHASIATGGDDCDDHDPTVYPGAPEKCDGKDNDCNGEVDDNPIDGQPFYADADGDGYGDPNTIVYGCGPLPPKGGATNDLDCYDANKDAHPTQAEYFVVDRGDGSFDYNCDGVVEPLRPTRGKCNGETLVQQGWDGPVPDCGKSETYIYSCKPGGLLKETQSCQ